MPFSNTSKYRTIQSLFSQKWVLQSSLLPNKRAWYWNLTVQSYSSFKLSLRNLTKFNGFCLQGQCFVLFCCRSHNTVVLIFGVSVTRLGRGQRQPLCWCFPYPRPQPWNRAIWSPAHVKSASGFAPYKAQRAAGAPRKTCLAIRPKKYLRPDNPSAGKREGKCRFGAPAVAINTASSPGAPRSGRNRRISPQSSLPPPPRVLFSFTSWGDKRGAEKFLLPSSLKPPGSAHERSARVSEWVTPPREQPLPARAFPD